MTDKKKLSEKIRQIYPDIGECGINVDVEYDNEKKVWVVDLKQGDQKLKTYLEESDAASCMIGKQCVSLGIEIAQLRANIKGRG